MSKKTEIFWLVVIAVAVVAIAWLLVSMWNKSHEYDGASIEQEKKRFEQVLQDAPDEELLLMLRYAMYNHYVPTCEVDPFFDRYAVVGRWHRTLRIYNVLSTRNREDLLKRIYPDLEDLENYVFYNGFDLWKLKSIEDDITWEQDSFLREEHDELVQDMQLRRLYEVAKIIDRRLAKDSSMFQLMTSEATKSPDCLVNKYFDTPLVEDIW